MSLTNQLDNLKQDVESGGASGDRADALSLELSILQLHFSMLTKTVDLILLSSRHGAFLSAALVASVGLWASDRLDSWQAIVTVIALIISILTSVCVHLWFALLHSDLLSTIDDRAKLEDKIHKNATSQLIWFSVAQVALTVVGILGVLWVYLLV